MKKIWITLILFTLLLSACSGAAATAAPAQDTGTTSNATTTDAAAVQGTPDAQAAQAAPANGEFPQIAKVLLGSFLLENTDLAITAEQAATLLPLWKGLNALQNSETVTNEEMQGLYDQIIGSMTPEQIAQIETLNINQDSMRTVMESIGLGGKGGPAGDGNLTEEQIATMEAERAANGDAGMPAGGPGGGPGGDAAGMPAGGPGGGGPGGETGMAAAGAASGTQVAVMPEQAGDPTLRMMSRVIQPLLELLQKKIDG
jgi:hypothetical protein